MLCDNNIIIINLIFSEHDYIYAHNHELLKKFSLLIYITDVYFYLFDNDKSLYLKKIKIIRLMKT